VTQQVHMEDGTELSLLDHLRDGHHKGTRGFKEDFLRDLHRTLHQRKREDDDAEPSHEHPGDEAPSTPDASDAPDLSGASS
jgi:hypothetical protein